MEYVDELQFIRGSIDIAEIQLLDYVSKYEYYKKTYKITTSVLCASIIRLITNWPLKSRYEEYMTFKADIRSLTKICLRETKTLFDMMRYIRYQAKCLCKAKGLFRKCVLSIQ